MKGWTKNELTHVVFRSWCRHCVSGRAREDPHRRIATHDGRTPKATLDCKSRVFNLLVLVVYDLSTGAVMAMLSAGETVAAVEQTLETWGHADVVLHAEGEPATKSLVRSIGDCPGASDSAEASRSVHSGFPRDLRGKQVGSGGRNRLPSCAETSRDCVVDPSRCLADNQVQRWTRWMLSLQEDLWQAISWQHLQVW